MRAQHRTKKASCLFASRVLIEGETDDGARSLRVDAGQLDEGLGVGWDLTAVLLDDYACGPAQAHPDCSDRSPPRTRSLQR
jgi:hypothetical protein